MIIMVEEIIDFHSIYSMTEVIGEGSYGIVNMVTGKLTGRRFALKRIRLSKANIGALKVEWNVINELTKIQSCGVHTPIYYDRFILLWQGVKWYCFLMEYIQGDTLQKYINNNRRTGTIIPVPSMRKFMIAMLEALVCMHNKNIVHRDIKAANIIFSTNITLIDFGFACFTYGSNVDIKDKCMQSLKGTPNYMSPEELNRSVTFLTTDILKKSDVWALGILFYFLSNNRQPFDAITRDELYRKIKAGEMEQFLYKDKSINAITRLMLTYDPKQRPDAHELLTAMSHTQEK